MLTQRLWERVEYTIAEKVISFQVKHLRYEEAEPLKISLAHGFDALNRSDEVRKAAEADAEAARARGDSAAAVTASADSFTAVQNGLHDAYKALPMDTVREAFAQFVRHVRGVEFEDLDEKDQIVKTEATTGEQLYAIADEQLVWFVLGKLNVFARLGKDLASSSPSPSTSDSQEASVSSSPAPLTGSVDGPTPSTATEPSGSGLSGAPQS